MEPPPSTTTTTANATDIVGEGIIMSNQSQPPDGGDDDQVSKLNKKKTVDRFAAILGSPGSSSGTTSSSNCGSTTSTNHHHHAFQSSNSLRSLFANDLADDQIVLILPSVDLALDDADNNNNNSNGKKDASSTSSTSSSGTSRISNSTSSLLPGVGEHSEILSASGAPTTRPAMTASLLTGAVGCSRPPPSMTASVLSNAMEHQDTASKDEKEMIERVNGQTSWTKSTLNYAPATICSNISESFSSLLNSRVRAWTLLLLRHSLTAGDDESRKRLLNMLKSSIKVDSVETKYKTLPMPESTGSQKQQQQEKDADVILPLLFEAKLNLLIEDKPENVTLLAPGTIAADFAKGSTGTMPLRKVAVRVDSRIVLKAMIEQARMVVLKAVASATKTEVLPGVRSGSPLSKSTTMTTSSTSLAGKRSLTGDNKELKRPIPGRSSSIAGFRSMLNLSPQAGTADSGRSPMLQKAQSSALRLNNVLRGKSDGPGGSGVASGSTNSLLGRRTVRSVKWDSPSELPKLNSDLAPDPKKQRMAYTSAKLTSFKSFGRPHGGGGGPITLNATFGEYGGRQQTWGRDGRLAHHPSPMQMSGTNESGLLSSAMGGSSNDRNATFGMFKPKRNLSAARAMLSSTSSASVLVAATGVGSASASSTASSPSTASLPRTPTALENWLMTKSTSGGKVM